MKSITRRPEFYFDFDTYFETNFASHSSLEQAIKATEHNIQLLSTGDYTEFVARLNHARAKQAAEKHAYIPKANIITLDNFVGAVVFPGNSILSLYQEKWGLPPIHLLVALPKDRMTDIKKKLGYEGDLSQVTFPTTYFPPSSMGLHSTGMTLLEKPPKINIMEFYSARFDAPYYSQGYQAVMQHIKLVAGKPHDELLPRLACFMFEYDLLFDMLANKSHSPTKKSLYNYYDEGAAEERGKNSTHTLLRRVGITQHMLAQYPASDCKKYNNAFEEYVAEQCADIEKVIDALYFMEDTLGSNLIRPALFAVGPKQEELDSRDWHTGPFAMLRACAFSLSNGLLTKDYVHQKVLEKGYTRGYSSLETGPVRA